MDLTVIPNATTPTRGHLKCGASLYDCALGRAGVTTDKREGDGATPAGRFPLRQVFYRADRLDAPTTGLPCTSIQPHDGWCDHPTNSKYNQLVQHPYAASAEHLWRDDHRYDLVVVLGHNDDPIVPGAGSAIFLHIAAEDFRPTEGCIALCEADVIKVLAHCTQNSTIETQTVTEPS